MEASGGIEGKKEEGSDDSLRPRIRPEDLVENELTEYIGHLSEIRKTSPALKYGNYIQLAIEPKFLFLKEKVKMTESLLPFNIGDEERAMHFNARARYGNLILYPVIKSIFRGRTQSAA